MQGLSLTLHHENSGFRATFNIRHYLSVVKTSQNFIRILGQLLDKRKYYNYIICSSIFVVQIIRSPHYTGENR